MRIKLKPLVLLLSTAFLSCNRQNDGFMYLLVGTYTDESSTGIYVYKFDTETADCEYVGKATVSDPSYLCLSNNGKYVYSVSEGNESAAYAFGFDKGILTEIAAVPVSGSAPCYINANEKFVVTANYSSGNISLMTIADDGSLNEVSQILDFEGEPRSHLHCCVFSPDGKYLFAADLGKDCIYKFVVSGDTLATGKPDRFESEKGSGPRHITFHPDGKHVYAINELSGKVTVFDYSDGNLKAKQYIASDTTSGSGNKGSADIHVSPDGKFLYSSNRLKSDGIAVFRINRDDGLLTRVGYQNTGIHPRNFIITPSGKYLLVANRDSNNIQIFNRNADTGLLTDTGKEIKIGKPVCLKFADFSE